MAGGVERKGLTEASDAGRERGGGRGNAIQGRKTQKAAYPYSKLCKRQYALFGLYLRGGSVVCPYKF